MMQNFRLSPFPTLSPLRKLCCRSNCTAFLRSSSFLALPRGFFLHLQEDFPRSGCRRVFPERRDTSHLPSRNNRFQQVPEAHAEALDHTVSWVLSFAGEAKILNPPELKKEVAKAARRILKG